MRARLWVGLLALACSEGSVHELDEPPDAGLAPDTSTPDATSADARAPAPFTVELVEPGPDAVVGGRITVRAQVEAGGRLLRGVEFLAGPEPTRFDADLSEPFEGLLDTTDHPDGALRLQARAVDFDGEEAIAEVTVQVDNRPPEVRQLSPEPEAMVFFDDGSVDLAFAVEDASDVADVELTVNGLPVPIVDAGAGDQQGHLWVAHPSFEALHVFDVDLPITLVVGVRATDALGQRAEVVVRHPVERRLRWSYQTFGEIWGGPAVAPDGTVRVGSNDGVLHAVSESGEALWTYDAGGEVLGSPAVALDGAAYFGAGSSLHAVDAAGARRWRVDAGGSIGSSPALSRDGATVYFGSYADRVHALRAQDGGEVWRHEVGGDVLSSPAVGLDGTVYVGSHDHSLHAIAPDGASRWTFETGGEVWGGPLVTRGGPVLVGSNDGYLYALEPQTGERRWEFDTRGEIWGTPAEAGDGTLYVGSTFRRLRALSAGGEQRWQLETGGLAQSSPAVDAAGNVYIGSTDRLVYASSSNGEVLWTFETEAQILASPVLSPDQATLYVGSTDRRLYALRTGLPAARCDEPEMAQMGDLEVMAFEASRPDATADGEGRAVGRACSVRGVRPWTGASWVEAQAACAAAGMSLCTAAQWRAACAGPDGAELPYGAEPAADACNGADHPDSGCDQGACEPRPGGALARCVSPQGAYDMSGNLWEWTADVSPVLGAGFRVTVGGSYRTSGDTLRCTWDDSATSHQPEATEADDLGFRCCRGG